MNFTTQRNLIRFLLVLILVSKFASTTLSGQSNIEVSANNINPVYYNQGNNFNDRSLLEFGFGGGICLKGGLAGFEFTLVRPNDWGGSISYRSNFFRSTNIPTDWDEGGRTFYPKNYGNFVSFNLIREFPAAQDRKRFGIEGGLSWVVLSQALLEPNPDYDPSPDQDVNWMYKIGTKYKYDKSHFRSSTIGVDFRVKVEFLLSSNTGFELAAFTNLNSLSSTAGLELNFVFGRLN